MNADGHANKEGTPRLNRNMGDRFRLVFEASSTAMVLADPLGRIMMANSSASALFGHEQDELTGRSVDTLMAEKCRQDFAALRGRFATGHGRKTEGAAKDMFVVRKDGGEVPVHVGLSPVATREGVCVLAVFTDISEHQRVQEEMHQRRYLEGIVASLRESLVVLDADMKIVSASKSFHRTFGINTADIAGKNFFELEGGRWNIPRLRELLGEILLKDAPLDEFEADVDFAQNGRRTMLLSADRIDREAGRANLIVLAIEDITKRKQVENELLHQRELLRVLLDNFPASIYYKDAESRFTAVSRYKAQRHNCEPADLIGKTDFDVFPEARARKAFEDEQQIIRTGEAMVGMEEREVWTDRPDTWTLTSKMPLRDHRGRIIGTFGISHNITEHKRAEEEIRRRKADLEKANADLARSNADLAQFAYVASHDLQEPLRAVSGCIQILQKRQQGRSDATDAELMSHIVSGAERMQKLIQDLLAYSRVGTKGEPFRPVRFQEILDGALKNLAAAVQESGAVITHDELPVVAGDTAQLRQLMQNLLGNAIKFRGSEPPRLHIGAELREGAWHFLVRDNGIGIEPQYFDRIFAMFQRLHTRANYPGTGIGLAICKKVVERHGGRIWVESAPGAGSTFHFTLPETKEKP